MSTSYKPSKACCQTPPYKLPAYDTKGEFTQLADGTDIYVTGPPTATVGLLVIYDVFGYYPQTLQAADVLAGVAPLHSNASTPAGSTNTSIRSIDKQYRVFLPDFLKGAACPYEWGDGSAAGQAKIDEFFETGAPADMQRGALNVHAFRDELAASSLGAAVKEWVLVGYCWGGYVASLVCSEEGAAQQWRAAVQGHPGCAETELARKIAVPTLVILSKDEVEEEKRPMMEGVKECPLGPDGVRFVEMNDMPHGFMAARGDLGNEKVRARWEEAYSLVLSFLEEKLVHR